MKKGIFAVTYIHKTRIEVRQDFFYPAKINVTYCILLIPLLAVEFNKYFFFQQSNVHTRLGGIDYQLNIACQISGLYIWKQKIRCTRLHTLVYTENDHALK